MPATVRNTQPIFSFQPYLVMDTRDAVRITNITSGTPDTIYTEGGTYGSVMNKITVSSCGDLTYTTVSAKLVYIYIRSASVGTWALRYNASIPSTTISTTTVNPTITFEPTGGILLKKDDNIGIGVSENFSNSGERGDYISYTIEGSTF